MSDTYFQNDVLVAYITSLLLQEALENHVTGSNLPVLSKIPEKVVATYLKSHFSNAKISIKDDLYFSMDAIYLVQTMSMCVCVLVCVRVRTCECVCVCVCVCVCIIHLYT